MDRARASWRRLRRRARARGSVAQPRAVTLVEWGVFPDNPWQRVIAEAATRDGIRVETLDHGEELDDAIARARPGRAVVHFNWTAPISQRAQHPSGAGAAVDAVLRGVDRLHDAGGSLLWTLHNERAHELVHLDAEERLVAGLASRADAVHVMHRSATALLPEEARSRAVVVPHPSYEGIYDSAIDRVSARAALGVPPHATAILAFGLLRPYKDLPATVRGFLSASATRGDLHLLVAGQPGQGYDAAWLEPVMGRADATIHVGFVAPEDVATWHRAADVVAMPQRTGLNSGTLLLAATFGLPVIAGPSRAASGPSAEGWAVTIDPGADDWLATGLAALPADATQAARRAADLVSPARVGAEVAAVIRRLATRD